MKYRAIYRGGDVIAKFENDQLVWAADEYLHPEQAHSHMIMPDIQPYRSMIDGTMITSRSQHRAHLKANNCFEVGNETKHLKSKPLTPPPGLKRTLVEVANSKL